MLTTAAMIRLGYVYGNLMVNVQPRNDKLRDRAVRIVRDASGFEEARAAELLREAGAVRTAIVMALRNIDRSAAEVLLERAGGTVSGALAIKE
jgi:N-acetylmuramic acid 6-phosphate etherase